MHGKGPVAEGRAQWTLDAPGGRFAALGTKPMRAGSQGVLPTCTKADSFRTFPGDGCRIGPMHDPQGSLVFLLYTRLSLPRMRRSGRRDPRARFAHRRW